MVQKAIIRNEHRDAWREGDVSDIPKAALDELERLYPNEKGQNAKVQKTKKAKEVAEDDGA